MTAGADKNYPLDYSHLNIQGYAVGAKGMPEGIEANPDTTIFSNVDTKVSYGWESPIKMTMPIFTGALGSTEIARKNWEHFAVGAAISGITIVCGENVCGIDPGLELDANGKITSSPEMDRRIEIYRRYHQGYGDMVVQMNVEDTRLGVAEYIIRKHGMDTIELKWGQGAKCIGGEIKVRSIERAQELKSRGYNVLPDPTLPSVQAAYADGAITEFERHSRLGFVSLEAFMQEVERLRGLGFKRISLKTGAYSAVELAMALRYGAGAGLDMITLDGAPGGTGMSPWPMMNEWGMPALYQHAMAYEFCQKLTRRGIRVPDIAVAGGFSSEDGVFKALAMGSPYVKAVCMGRALMIPGMVGKNIGMWIEEDNLPKTVARYGSKVEEIFVSYEELKEKFGDEVDNLPLGAIGIYTYAQKFKTGLQQLMAGSRNFSIPSISRRDLMALTEEAAKVTGIPYVMDAYRQEAEDILEDLGQFEREAGMIPLGEPTAVLRVLREGRSRPRISILP
jgi:glutamate synthase domain-containing protein 2